MSFSQSEFYDFLQKLASQHIPSYRIASLRDIIQQVYLHLRENWHSSPFYKFTKTAERLWVAAAATAQYVAEIFDAYPFIHNAPTVDSAVFQFLLDLSVKIAENLRQQRIYTVSLLAAETAQFLPQSDDEIVIWNPLFLPLSVYTLLSKFNTVLYTTQRGAELVPSVSGRIKIQILVPRSPEIIKKSFASEIREMEDAFRTIAEWLNVGISPENIVVYLASPTLARFVPLFAEKYRVPVKMAMLAENYSLRPLARWVLNLCEIVLTDFFNNEVLAFIKNPLFDAPYPEFSADVESFAKKQFIGGGIDKWMHELQSGEAYAVFMRLLLKDICELNQVATAEEHIIRITQIIEKYGVAELVSDDMPYLAETFLHVITAYGDAKITLRDIYLALRVAFTEAAHISPQKNAVLITSPANCRPSEYAIIAGLVENPTLRGNYDLLPDEEMARINRLYALPVFTTTELDTARIEESLRTIVYITEKRLILTYSATANGHPQNPSFFYCQMPGKVADAETHPPLTVAELCAWAAKNRVPAEILLNYNITDYFYLSKAITAEFRIAESSEFTEYEAQLQSFIPEKMHASGFESYLFCPQQYFLKHVLELTPPVQKQTLEWANVGTLVHSIMENVFAKFSAPAIIRKKPATLKSVAEDFASCADDILRTFEEIFAEKTRSWKVPVSLLAWKETVIRDIEPALRRKIADEVNLLIKNDGFVVATEMRFQLDSSLLKDILSESLAYQIKGRIDRVDFLTSTNTLQITDYKHKNTLPPILDEKNIQIVLYANVLRNRQILINSLVSAKYPPFLTELFPAEYTLHMRYISTKNTCEKPEVAAQYTKTIEDNLRKIIMAASAAVRRGMMFPFPFPKNILDGQAKKYIILRRNEQCEHCHYSSICPIQSYPLVVRQNPFREVVM